MTEQTLSIETDCASHYCCRSFGFGFKQNKRGGELKAHFYYSCRSINQVFLPLTAPFDPIEQNRSALLLPPAWYEGGNSTYLLGTDDIGRDILSRIFMVRAFLFCRFHYCHFILHFRNESWLARRLLWWEH